MSDTKIARKTKVGSVISNKMDKTIVVKVETLRQHPRYIKYTKYSKNYKAHDEDNTCGIGDKVKIVETRPLSKEKRWRVMEILGKVGVVEIFPLEINQNNDPDLH